MTWHNTHLGQALHTMLQYLGTKQAVINENIANANTPKYRAKDVQQPDFAALIQGKNPESPQANISLTNMQHLTGTNPSSPFRIIENNSGEPSANQNNVSVQREMLALSQMQTDFQASLNLFRKLNEMMRTALGSKNT